MVRKRLGRCLDKSCRFIYFLLELCIVGRDIVSGQCLDPADTSRDAALRENLDATPFSERILN